MNNHRKHLVLIALSVVLALLSSPLHRGLAQSSTATPGPLGGATTFAKADSLTPVTLMLDYTPNTNHLGFYVAQARGYFKDANLDVTIIQPGDVQVEQLVASGKVQFGVSYQEQMTYSRAQALPIVSLAAIIQHNTSGFAALHSKHPLATPADLSGLRYGAFGSPVEKPLINLLMACDQKPVKPVAFIDVGFAEPLPLMAQDRIDFVWLFYAWDGIRAKQQGVALDFLMLKDYTRCIPDYYTPLLITSEALIKAQPGVVRAFTQAAARGYADAITGPAQAAELFIKAVPETDAALVRESGAWLATQFQADAARWGQQDPAIWQGYADWLAKNGALEKPLDMSGAFTNEFLPGAVPATKAATP
jgi:ABC-type nitrate/sulfonate/bicarbonate transport system substrate-binding protein